MKRLLVVAALLAAVLSATGCSSASGICDAVKRGEDPVAASGASYSAAGGSQKEEQAEKLREAAEEIRSSCPAQSNAAERLEGVAATLGV